MATSATTRDPFQPVGFDCNGCGKCCTNLSGERGILLGPADVVNLARALDMPPSEVVTRFVTLVRFEQEPGSPVAFTIADQDGACPFLDEDNRCRVHARKPAQCRMGPFGILWPRGGSEDYDCAQELEMPEDWSTEEQDRLFLSEVLHENESAALVALLQSARGR